MSERAKRVATALAGVLAALVAARALLRTGSRVGAWSPDGVADVLDVALSAGVVGVALATGVVALLGFRRGPGSGRVAGGLLLGAVALGVVGALVLAG
ncbi:hypothetical protein [Actinosynnema pretiosum]|uniref:Uncharacterized protein n=1 Tax=Actinosynnema pretiosum TaxID=42197 RepID=A0A290Z8B8_9PSEU|nr:hypothetical protein [Actinosynnema pretiosum]ATE55258.1 hypothetical protein CNX65_19850 [Actinosynnema pretiosum]